MTRALTVEPLSLARYTPYGELVVAGDPAKARAANHGTAEAWDALATLVSRRVDARATASLFRCHPHLGETLEVRVLERHPDSTQMFVPMGTRRYLVIVALGADAPDLATAAAFIVEGAQAITYRPGTWHHPMVALDTATDFVNVLFTDGSARDCEEVHFASAPLSIALPVFRTAQ